MARKNQLRINEIFHSIQGEGTRAGRRCVFVRLTGCHLRCTYCDTEYAFYEGGWMTLDAILDRVGSYECSFVEVTGGEPLLQPNVYPLLERLADAYATVAIETSGTLSIARVDPRIVRIVDFKAPSSGEAGRNDWSNVDLLTERDEVKIVIGTREDYEWARDAVDRRDLPRRCPVLFSPVVAPPEAHNLLTGAAAITSADLAGWVLADRLDVRVNVQIHKVIWPPRMRGV